MGKVWSVQFGTCISLGLARPAVGH